MNAPAATAATNGRKPRKSTLRRLVVWALGLALLGAIVAGFWPKPIEVEMATVTTGPMSVSVLEEGKTRIRHRYVISPPVAGMLERIPLRAGAGIEAGKTVLATIHPSPASFLDPRTKAEAEARVLAAEASKKLRAAQLERAQAALNLAEKELTRTEQLRKQRAVSEREFDQASNQVAILQRELHAAQFAGQVAEYELTQAQAAARQAADPTAETAEPFVLKAPVDGFVLNVFEESARAVTPGLQLMEVGNPQDLEAEIELLSSDAVAVAEGADVSIEKWGGDKPLRAAVALVEPGGYTKVSALGVEEQRVKVRVNFVDPLPPGNMLGDRYRVEARMITWKTDAAIQLPSGALFRRGDAWMTFLFEGGHARAVPVTIGHNNGLTAEVLGGVTVGQRVLLHPPDKVADGTAVVERK